MILHPFPPPKKRTKQNNSKIPLNLKGNCKNGYILSENQATTKSLGWSRTSRKVRYLPLRISQSLFVVDESFFFAICIPFKVRIHKEKINLQEEEIHRKLT